MTSIGFVSTSVLESKDGIDFGEEKRLETEEVKEAEKRALEAARQPLWEQLQEREDAKAEQFEAVRKAIFAPPKALESEDIDFLDSAEAARKAAQAAKRAREAQEVEAFASARANQVVACKPVLRAGAAAPKRESGDAAAAAARPAQPVVAVVKKRLKDKEGGGRKKAKKSRSSDGGVGAKAVVAPAKAAAKAEGSGSEPEAGGLGGLVAYGSDDSE